MDWNLILANSALTAVVTVILTWLAKPYFDAYLRKKGEQRAVLEDLNQINRKIEAIRTEFIERNAYLAEKGKSAATKEDVEEINHKIESIRNEYAQTIEILRWQLSRRATMHRLRVEKELNVLSDIWEAAAELRFATQELRPILEYINPDEPEQEKWQRKMQKFGSSYNNLVNAIEKYKPFYPVHIYSQLIELLGAAQNEKIDCEAALEYGKGRLKIGAYAQAQKNINSLLSIINNICEALRARLNEADSEGG